MPSPARSVRTGTVEGIADRPQGGSATMVLLRHLLGDALRRLRLRQGRTLREVSATARVSLGYLSEVERGRKEASSELLASICDALGAPLSQVLREVSDGFALAELQNEPAFGVPLEPALAGARPSPRSPRPRRRRGRLVRRLRGAVRLPQSPRPQRRRRSASSCPSASSPYGPASDWSRPSRCSSRSRCRRRAQVRQARPRHHRHGAGLAPDASLGERPAPQRRGPRRLPGWRLAQTGR